MGTWGIKLQSTVEKAREKASFRHANFSITSGTRVPRGTDWTSAALQGLVQWSIWVPLFGVLEKGRWHRQ
eukprot:1996924-Rhodomonas_salina.1